ncbi:MAG: DUF4124 domain-containing protein [Stagnimonas sp.]|nr:DUF4124 domain-containing protein [Stagnimonas sp.]
MSEAPRRSLRLPGLLVAGCLLLAAGPAAAQQKQNLYRWVDEKGQVHFGDRIPPQYAKQGREELNQQGLVTKTVPHEPTAEDLARQREQAELAAKLVQRRDHDRYLLQSFGSVADLQAAREDRLTALDGRITLAQKAAVENEATLEELRGRAGGKAPDEKLAKQIESFENGLVDNLQLIQRLQVERGKTEQTYAEDIERFKLLRAGKIKPGD